MEMPCSVQGCKLPEVVELAPEFPATKELGDWYRCSCPKHGFDGYVTQYHWTYYVQTQEKKAGK